MNPLWSYQIIRIGKCSLFLSYSQLALYTRLYISGYATWVQKVKAKVREICTKNDQYQMENEFFIFKKLSWSISHSILLGSKVVKVDLYH